MKEYFVEAIVLDKEDLGEYDSRVFLYTKEFGRLAAKAKSSRKITSKLAAHLEPLNLIRARLICAKDFQVVDALRMGRLDRTLMPVLHLVKEICMENQPDQLLWQLLEQQYRSQSSAPECAKEVLRISGFDPDWAACQSCKSRWPTCFLLDSAAYVCGRCFVKLSSPERHFSLDI